MERPRRRYGDYYPDNPVIRDADMIASGFRGRGDGHEGYRGRGRGRGK